MGKWLALVGTGIEDIGYSMDATHNFFNPFSTQSTFHVGYSRDATLQPLLSENLDLYA